LSDPHGAHAFPEQAVLAALRRSWSKASSTLWSAERPARGQCGVSALVIQDHFGGEILKTPLAGGWHFYNRVAGRRFDLTSEQFASLPAYRDLPATRAEALADTNGEQYAQLFRRFAEEYVGTGQSVGG
jgi:hypothetical protein